MHRCRRSSALRCWALVLGVGIGGAASVAPVQAQELCGGIEYPFPYTDVSGVGAAFCPGIMEAYVTGVSKGTSPTTFSPNETVTRVQMTTFLQRSLDQGLTRTGRRAALNQWWVPQNTASMQTITVAVNPLLCAADGADIWVSGGTGVARVEGNTGKVLGTWTGGTATVGVIPAAGKVFVTDFNSPGKLYAIDPTAAPGALPSVATLPNEASGIAFDGTHLWTANFSGSVSMITPQSPYTVTTPTTVFVNPLGILYDGAHIWVTDNGAGALIELDSSGNVLKTVTTGTGPAYPVFDGTNIWVPNYNDSSLTVVQASSGSVVAQISADANNKLSNPEGAAFDGERVLVTNNGTGSVTLFKAADLSLIGNIPTGSFHPWSTCSDGITFWVPLLGSSDLLRL
jgi:DNA-binding beta-propeller fold protein YncE